MHQERAWTRLQGEQAKSTLVATGTGSGKTECFTYPILDHILANPAQRGIKAIILYPMNALASDQARRFAKEVHNNPAMEGKVRVGLYVGGQESGGGSKSMSETGVITNREEMRKSPPDILMTNYKMLDYLLIRQADRGIWAENQPDTLRYLVVDELHTFDGAQGTDLACLIRRVKARLKTPAQTLCCVGTSATLGGEGNEQAMVEFAEMIFGEPFKDEECAVAKVEDRVALAKNLRRHNFLRAFLGYFRNGVIEEEEILADLARRYGKWEESHHRLLINSFVSLCAVARTAGQWDGAVFRRRTRIACSRTWIVFIRHSLPGIRIHDFDLFFRWRMMVEDRLRWWNSICAGLA